MDKPNGPDIMPELDTPQHPWNDPDNDGHDCVDCPGDSIWKCDQFAHDQAEILRATWEQAVRESQRQMAPALRKMQVTRQRGACDAHRMPLP